jgi:hypothetical protein
MLWKRKEYDVFPDYIGNQQEVNPRFANYAKIKDNVVVVPVKDFIFEKGFLPDPNKKRRKKRNDGKIFLPTVSLTDCLTDCLTYYLTDCMTY